MIAEGRGDSEPPLEFRRATLGDVPRLVDLRLEFMRIVKDAGIEDEAGWRDELARRFAGDLASGLLVVWVCVDAGSIVATGGIGFRRRGSRVRPVASAGPTAEILNMFTLPAYRRRGIGAELLGRCLADGRARGVARFRLQPTDDGRRLYERAGFRELGSEMELA